MAGICRIGRDGLQSLPLHGLVLFVTYRVVFAEWAAMVSSVEHWAMALCVVPVLILLCFTTFRLIEKPAMDAVPLPCVAAGRFS